MVNKQEVYTDHEQRFFLDDQIKNNKMMTDEEVRLLKKLEQSYLAGVMTYTDTMLEYKEFVIKQYNEAVYKNNKTKY